MSTRAAAGGAHCPFDRNIVRAMRSQSVRSDPGRRFKVSRHFHPSAAASKDVPMSLSRFALAAALLSVATTAAFAQPGPPGRGGPPRPGPGGNGGGPGRGENSAPSVDAFISRMTSFDADQDGKLTRSEVTDPRLQSLFQRADADGDGTLTKDELRAFHAKESASLGSRRGGRGGGPGGAGRGPGGPPGGRPGADGDGGRGGPPPGGPGPDERGPGSRPPRPQ